MGRGGGNFVSEIQPLTQYRRPGHGPFKSLEKTPSGRGSEVAKVIFYERPTKADGQCGWPEV